MQPVGQYLAPVPIQFREVSFEFRLLSFQTETQPLLKHFHMAPPNEAIRFPLPYLLRQTKMLVSPCIHVT